MWAENALFEIGRNLAGLGPKSPEQIDEATLGAEVLLAICEEIKKRNV
jgi:hypothetical protein